jgi:uncharacterized protein with PIN domain
LKRFAWFASAPAMSRIRKAYEARFRALLLQLHAQRLEPGVAWLVRNAIERRKPAVLSPAQALGEAYERLRNQVARWQARARPDSGPYEQPRGPTAVTQPCAPLRFVCDAGLGGLARWLRAAGYDASWLPDAADADVVRQARELRATLLTTDSLMMQRRVLRDGIVPALWLPPTLTKAEQLSLVLREFDLALLPPRCMSCGGELRRVEKEQMRDRIPPRTWRWLDEYFACTRCDRVFWHGTHWEKIRQQLAKVSGQR